MKKSVLFLFILSFVGMSVSHAQHNKNTKALKGNGEVFYTEPFGWENPADPKGWTAGEGFYMEDPDDNGMNFHWWGTDSLISLWTREPSGNFTTKGNGCLALFLNKYNEDRDASRLDVNNSIVFPALDCSGRTSVIVRYETCFMNYAGAWDMLLEVTVDNWVHSAVYDAGFGLGHKGRPNVQPGKPGIFEANITDVAAGMGNVQFKLTWRGTSLYFWQIDDFTVAEAWDNDLRMKHFVMEWEDFNEDSHMSVYQMMPISQLNGGSMMNFQASAINFGEFDQEDVYLDLDISKNNASIMHQTSAPVFVVPLLSIDTANIAQTFTPTEFGHYKIKAAYKQAQAENTPENNMTEIFFHVTDSVYASADDTAEEEFCWGLEAYSDRPNEQHFMGVKFPIFADCEVNSITAYIAGGKADGLIEYRMALFLVPGVEEEDQTPISWLVSDIFTLDSSMIDTWITLPLDKDGESEFLFAGDVVYAGVEYWNWHEDLISRRYDNLKLGADWNKKLKDPVSIAKGDGDFSTGGYVAERNLMVHLNINDHSNIIDNVDISQALSYLGQNYPNPFSHTTEIMYELVNASNVTIEVMDLTGRVVLSMNEGQQPAGKHMASITASDLEAGLYFYTLKAGNFSETKRMVVK